MRRGDIVVRETGPWAPSVHALLHHLERVGFAGAPRVVGLGLDDQGRELLTYIEGDIVHPAPWSDAAIAAFGRLLRKLHDATKTFVPPDDAIWRAWFGRDIGSPDVIGHCDAAPWNVVFRDGEPVALIDWEVAGPVDRLTEVAMAAWNGAQLYDDDVAAMNDLPDAGARLRKVRLFADAYGLATTDRRCLADRIVHFAAQSEVMERGITPDTVHTPMVWGIAWRTRSVAWLLRHRTGLEAVLA